MAFYEYPARTWQDILPDALDDGHDLVKRLVQYESELRMSAKDVLEHAYMKVKIG